MGTDQGRANPGKTVSASRTARGTPCVAPPWARRLAGDAARPEPGRDGVGLCVSEGDGFAMVSVHVRDAVVLDADAFRVATIHAYEAIAARLADTASPCPVRYWNAIPGILDPLGDSPHRYMVFNAGRHEAYRRRAVGEREVPTASGVGHEGRDLVVHCLAAREPGRSVENPRQTPAYRYSARYGLLPPTFARGTLLDRPSTGRRWLLTGGTASILGEDCAHAGDVQSQLDETLGNLRALVRAAAEADAGTDTSRPCDAGSARPSSVRVYFVRPDTRARLQAAAAEHFPGAEVEMVPADLCRPELLVEIEAVFEYVLPVAVTSSPRPIATVLTGVSTRDGNGT